MRVAYILDALCDPPIARPLDPLQTRHTQRHEYSAGVLGLWACEADTVDTRSRRCSFTDQSKREDEDPLGLRRLPGRAEVEPALGEVDAVRATRPGECKV